MDLSQSVAASLARRIAAGVYAPGERLPGVRSLASEMSVSVATIRGALVVLEEALLVTTEPRVGTTVRGAVSHGGIHAWALLAVDPTQNTEWLRRWVADTLDLWHEVILRVAREIGAVSDMTPVHDALRALRGTVRLAPTARELAVDGQVHLFRAILGVTGHPAYQGLLNEFYAVVRRTPLLVYLVAPDTLTMVDRWASMIELVPELSPSTVEGLLRPLLRAGAEETLSAFDRWVADSKGAG